jgi:Zn finger protein HypA/HybF involved in hydrogenase expression
MKGVYFNLKTEKNYNKGVCQCRKCGHVFHNTGIKHTYSNTLGQNTNTNECPECGSTNWGHMDEIFIKSDEWLYADAKNWGGVKRHIFI